jgi:hypothetical protein
LARSTGCYAVARDDRASDREHRWSASETKGAWNYATGSRHIYDHPFLGLIQPFFPLLFALDLSRLE